MIGIISPETPSRHLIFIKQNELNLPQRAVAAILILAFTAPDNRLTMTANFAKPILGSSLPHNFRKITLELAREHDHPEGDGRFSYVLIAPLDAASGIDHETWKHNREASRVVRQRPGEPDVSGHLIRTRNGAWAFHYDAHGSQPDETGYRFGDEKFTSGEYVSIEEAGKTHVYRVARIERL